MSIGFNIEYKESISDNLHSSDYIYVKKDWLNNELLSIVHSLKNGFIPTICTCEFLGNKKEGYDFNDILSKEKIYSVDCFINFWNKQTQKYFKKNIIKEAKRIFSSIIEKV